jgi:hypothetical protein
MAHGARGPGRGFFLCKQFHVRLEAIKPGHLLVGAFRQSAAKIPVLSRVNGDRRYWAASLGCRFTLKIAKSTWKI